LAAVKATLKVAYIVSLGLLFFSIFMILCIEWYS